VHGRAHLHLTGAIEAHIEVHSGGAQALLDLTQLGGENLLALAHRLRAVSRKQSVAQQPAVGAESGRRGTGRAIRVAAIGWALCRASGRRGRASTARGERRGGGGGGRAEPWSGGRGRVTAALCLIDITRSNCVPRIGLFSLLQE
jgi:hypothetical protein